MAHLDAENPDADCFVFIAASGQPGRGRQNPQSGFAWWVFDPNSQQLKAGNNTLSAPIKDWHTAAALEAALEAITQSEIPTSSHIHFVSTLEYLTDLLNEDRSVRKETEYTRSNLDPLADEDKWRALDDRFDELEATVSAGPPKCAQARTIFERLRRFAKTLGYNADNSEDYIGQFDGDVADPKH